MLAAAPSSGSGPVPLSTAGASTQPHGDGISPPHIDAAVEAALAYNAVGAADPEVVPCDEGLEPPPSGAISAAPRGVPSRLTLQQIQELRALGVVSTSILQSDALGTTRCLLVLRHGLVCARFSAPASYRCHPHLASLLHPPLPVLVPPRHHHPLIAFAF